MMEPSRIGQAPSMMLSKSNRPAALGLVLLACGGQALDVGANRHGSGGNDAVDKGGSGAVVAPDAGGGSLVVGGSGEDSGAVGGSVGASRSGGGEGREPPPDPLPPEPWPDPTSCASSEEASIAAGTWTGYAQGQGDRYNFTLEIHGPSEQPCGTLTFGEPQVYPPATDPEAGYLPNDFDYKWGTLLEGYTYTLLSSQLVGSRLQARVSYAEPYASWCELQTPYRDDQNGGFRCLPLPNVLDTAPHTSSGCVGVDDHGQEHVYSCEQLMLCLGTNVCFCDEAGCIANADAQGTTFDVEIEGDRASGSLDAFTTILSRQ